jgi:hypothetical protein
MPNRMKKGQEVQVHGTQDSLFRREWPGKH